MFVSFCVVGQQLLAGADESTKKGDDRCRHCTGNAVESRRDLLSDDRGRRVTPVPAASASSPTSEDDPGTIPKKKNVDSSDDGPRLLQNRSTVSLVSLLQRNCDPKALIF